jgi:argininosuccinate lyase
MPFAPEYVRNVLNENFEDAKALFLEPLLAIHAAHLVMLAERGIVGAADARVLRDALAGVCRETVRETRYDGSCEDLFFFVEQVIAGRAGEAAGRLHTARSRNDIDMTMYRMRLRGWVLDLLGATLDLRAVLVSIATAHRETVFPAHTHTQRAQPTTLGHYLLGAVEQLERDAERLRAAFATTNRSPLGACAITGTAFPIDRDRTSDLLGFDGPTGNTYGSIATVDYLLESLSAIAVTLVGLGRVVQDMLLWCTAEFRYLRLDDGFVQVSSIMPQKRNPVALEHARSIGSKAIGQATAVLLSVHNTPFGDIVDTEDDLQPLVAQACRDGVRAVALVTAALETATFDVAEMERRATEGFITVTELADTLTREQGLPFAQSHAIAAGLVEAHRAAPGRSSSELLAEVSTRVAGRAVEVEATRLREILCPSHFVRVRETHGGPGPSAMADALRIAAAGLDTDRGWLQRARARLAAADDARGKALAAL